MSESPAGARVVHPDELAPVAMFRRPDGSVAAPEASAAFAPAGEDARQAALDARRADAAQRSGALFAAPPTGPVTTSPFALVSSAKPAGPTPEELAAEQQRQHAAQLAAIEAQRRAAEEEQRQALEAQRRAHEEMTRRQAAAAAQAQAQQAASMQLQQQMMQQSPPGAMEVAPGAMQFAPQPPLLAEAPAPQAVSEQDAALEAYHRFAREGSMDSQIAEDYYNLPPAGSVETAEREPEVVVADHLIPTGKPRRRPESDRRTGPLVAVGAVVIAVIGGGAFLFTKSSSPADQALPVTTTVVVDQSTATTGAPMTVPAKATSGKPYTLTVPAGWRAEADPTHAGGTHVDVRLGEQVLGESVTVASEPAATSKAPEGTRVDASLRLFGRPSEVLGLASSTGTQTRVATLTIDGTRYSVTMTVPSAGAKEAFTRTDAVAKSLAFTR